MLPSKRAANFFAKYIYNRKEALPNGSASPLLFYGVFIDCSQKTDQKLTSSP